jgi:hypothetical protein
MEEVGIFYGHLIYFTPIWYTYFGGHLLYFMVICYIFPFLVRCTKKNLATLVDSVSVLACLPLFLCCNT